MLPNSITQAIKKKAEEKYQFGDDFYSQVKEHIKNGTLFNWEESLTNNEMEYLEQLLLTFKPDLPFNNRTAYTSGYSDAIEMMPDLLKWWDNNAVRNGEDEWTVGAGKETKRYATLELLTKYFETKQ